MEYEKLSEISKKTYLKADLLYEFVIKYSDMMRETHDYGSGELLNMIEIHLLTYIDQNPGITVSQLARMWNRTKGSISQQVKKLEMNGYIQKVKHDTNGKLILLYATPSGKKLSAEHMHYDIVDIMQTMRLLLRNCTMEEIDAFYRVIGEYIKILDEE
jgi:DNA-binding MarR family transcriptional regulator